MKRSVTRVLAAALLAIVASRADRAHAGLISWVEFPEWTDGDTSGSGTSDELEVTATFSISGGEFRNGRPAFADGEGVAIADPKWPFDNVVVPRLTTVLDKTPSAYSLEFDYMNEGGLPEGGSLVVLDVESPHTSVKLTGLARGIEVPVNWTVSFLEVSGLNAEFPVWNSTTNTLTGTTRIDATTTNLVFFVTDRTLDSIRFDVNAPDGEGIGFNTAAQPVVLTPVPEPASLTLLAFGATALIGYGLRRRRQPGR